jgi:hypothetical protein
VAEVEDYARVEIRRMPEVSVLGSAVADLTHLVAELVENATSFSPPHTIVLVHGEPVGAGFAVEIEDRGLGMRPETMAESNRRISDAHQLDLFDSDRLGLFVVSRLAHRQNIDVSLRRSPYGGTTAVVLVPMSILAPTGPQAVEAVRHDRPLTPFDPFSAPDEDAVHAPRTAAASRVLAKTQQSVDRKASTVPVLTPRLASSQRQPAPAEQLAIGPAAAQEMPASTEERGEQSTGGLPRRTRQASLAPGLRLADTRSHSTDDAEAISVQISPEQARAKMSAFQHGWIRGRNGPSDGSTDA